MDIVFMCEINFGTQMSCLLFMGAQISLDTGQENPNQTLLDLFEFSMNSPGKRLGY